MSASPRRAVLLLVVALMVGGCGYGLVGRSSSLPEDIQDIYVQPLTNRTTRAQVDQLLTRAIADEFVKRRRFNVVSEAAGADALLSGTVVGFSERPVTFGAGGRGTEYEMQIVADMEFRRLGAAEPIWARTGYLFRETYEIDISAADYFDRSNLKLEELSEKFAETLLIDLLEGF